MVNFLLFNHGAISFPWRMVNFLLFNHGDVLMAFNNITQAYYTATTREKDVEIFTAITREKDVEIFLKIVKWSNFHQFSVYWLI